MIAVLAEIPDKRKASLEIRRVLKDDGLLAIGEFLPDPDYPRKKTVIHWCKGSDLELADEYGGVFHYDSRLRSQVLEIILSSVFCARTALTALRKPDGAPRHVPVRL